MTQRDRAIGRPALRTAHVADYPLPPTGPSADPAWPSSAMRARSLPRAGSGTVGPPCRVAALLDRLEGAGFIERRRDPADRRRVFVISTGKREREVAQAFQPLQQATQQLLSGYT